MQTFLTVLAALIVYELLRFVVYWLIRQREVKRMTEMHAGIVGLISSLKESSDVSNRPEA